MSLSADPVKTYIVDDPRIDFDRKAAYLVQRSGGDVTYRRWKANSASTSAISFNTLLPSRDTVVASKIHVRIPITVTIRSADANNAVADSEPVDEFLGLRFAPFTQCCNSIQLELNGKVQSTNIYRYLNGLMKFCNTRDEMTNDFSCMPTYLDTYPSYYDPGTSKNGGAGSPVASTYQTIMDPLKSYDDTCSYEPTGRIGYLKNITSTRAPGANSNTEVTLVFEIEEVIPLSPLMWGHRDAKGLIGLDTLNINFQIKDLSRMFCSSRYGIGNGPGAPDTALTFEFNQQVLMGAELEFIYIKPRANVPVPRTIRYPYNNIKDFSTQGQQDVACRLNYGVPVPDNQYSTQFANIQLQGVPKRLYIFARREDAQQTYYTPDTFARITGITLDLGTRSGLLSEATPQALYRMAVKNGYRGTWDQWYNQTGSVLCLDFASDVSLDLLDAPGALKQMQISFTLRYSNIYVAENNPAQAAVSVASRVNFTVYCIVVYDGMMIIKDGEVLLESNDVSALDVADSTKVAKICYDDLADYAYGGDFVGGSLSKFISKAKVGLMKAKDFAQKKVIPAAQKALPYVKKGVQIAADVLPVLAALGYSEDQIYDLMKNKGGKLAPKRNIKQRAIKQ